MDIASTVGRPNCALVVGIRALLVDGSGPTGISLPAPEDLRAAPLLLSTPPRSSTDCSALSPMPTWDKAECRCIRVT